MSNTTKRSRKETFLQDLAVWKAVGNLEGPFSGQTGQVQIDMHGRVHGRGEMVYSRYRQHFEMFGYKEEHKNMMAGGKMWDYMRDFFSFF